MITRPHVLVVEDEPLILMDIEDTLREEGYTVTGCTNRPQALVVLAKGGIEALVTDGNLQQENDGRELVTTLRLTQPTLPVIACSAQLPPYWQAFQHDAAFRQCSKPLNMGKLVTTLAQLLAASAQVDAPREWIN